MILKFGIFLFLFCSVKASAVGIISFTDADSAEDEVSLPVHNCNNYDCNSFCLKHLFVRGYCSGDACRCVIGQAKDLKYGDAHITEKFLSLRSCDDNFCDHLCRRLGFTGGVCVGDKCKCDINDGILIAPVISDSLEGCDSSTCNSLCQKLGFIGGACSTDKCYCYKYKTNFNYIFQRKKTTAPEAQLMNLPKLCNSTFCNSMCKLQNYIGGVCIGGNCYCI